jgi:chromosomal replication initiator protein
MQLTATYSVERNTHKLKEMPNTLLDEQKVDIILNTIVAYSKTPRYLIISPTRKREVCELRQIAMEIIKKNTSLMLKSIGNVFNGRDHSSVISAINKVNDLFETDKKFKEKYLSIQHELSSKFILHKTRY